MLTTINIKALPFNVGIVGSRCFNDDPKVDMRMYEVVRKFVYKMHKESTVISGGARGIDSYAADAAYLRKMTRKIYEPDKKRPSPQRFFERNSKIAKHLRGYEGVLVAFIDVDNNDGTMDTVKKCRAANVPVIELYFDSKGKFLFIEAPDEFVMNTDDEQ